MKKTAALILALIIALGMITTAFAAGTVMTVGSATASAGDQVQLPVTIENNPGFASVWLNVKYDKNVLTLDAITLGIAKNCIANPESGRVAGASASDIKGNGNLFTLTFTVNEDAAEGEYPVSIEVVEFFNANDDEIDVLVKTGYVSVKEEYVISYDANGGIGAPGSHSFAYDSDAFISSTIPSRYGYDFLGWAETPFKTTPDYAPGEIYTARENITLYAVWAAKVYTVSFDANGGANAPASLKKTHGESIVLPTGIPEREGHTFLGWATSPFAATPDYACGAAYRAEGNATLYAVWEIQTYTVSFDANGGKGGPVTLTKTWGQDLVIPENIPEKKGYEFIGWSINEVNYEKTVGYQPGSVYSENAPEQFFAVWRVDKNIPAGKTAIIAESINSRAGKTVEIPVTIKGNPGFASAQFQIVYDEEFFVLEEIRNGIVGDKALSNVETGRIAAASAQNINGDGTLFTLVFTVKDEAPLGIHDIEIIAEEFYSIDEVNIDPYVVNCELTVIDYIPGDSNGDGKITSRDATRILQYLIGSVDENNVDVDAADYNGDGKVTSRDATAILRYLIGG